ncbi:hypothetical protein HOY82DRAFT_570304 [Tuber indicum]|nr:hypothetical protein HOY82DRAFT_570304 [Tuber indicum]
MINLPTKTASKATPFPTDSPHPVTMTENTQINSNSTNQILQSIQALSYHIDQRSSEVHADVGEEFRKVGEIFGKVEKEFGKVGGEFGKVREELDAVHKRLDSYEERFEQLDVRLSHIDVRLAHIHDQLNEVEDRLELGIELSFGEVMDVEI